MNTLAFMIRFSLVVAGGLVARSLAVAQVATRSPFLPPLAGGAAAPTTEGGLEFHGYIDVGGGMRFRLHDAARKEGAWLAMNERNEALAVVVKGYDERRGALAVEHRGRSVVLSMREAKVVSSGVPPQAGVPVIQPGPGVGVAPAVTQAVVLNPTPADEQRRLEAVAAEVARRRALREQQAPAAR